MNSQDITAEQQAGEQLMNVQLEQAFQLFNQFSEKLTHSYAELESHVVSLTKELAEARSERLVQLAEKELLAYRLEGLLDALPAGIIVLNKEGCITQINPVVNQMLAVEKKQLIGNRWKDIALESFVDKGDELQLKDGRWVDISVCMVGDENSNAGVEKIILISDITETRNLQDRLNRQQRLSTLGEMISGLAHQIRTPLSSALLYISTLNHPRNKAQERIEFTEKAKERLLHLERIVSEMLMFAKGDVIESQYTDVPGFMHQLKESFEMDDRIKNRRFILDENLKNVIIKAGHDVMLSVIQNIIDNAIDACDNSLNTKTACIEINASINRAGMFEIRVQDNGCGISHEMKEKIIQPFFTTKATGTGLGLAVVNATVNRYGGELAIESEEGVGSCFIVTFPAVDKPGLLPSNLLSRESSEKNGEFSATLAQITKNRRNNTQEVAL